MLTVRSGFPCKCVPSQFLWVTRASCVHRMIVGTHVRGQVFSRGHFVDAHLERRQFGCGPWFSLACGFIRPSLVVAAPLDTAGCAHPFAVPNRTLSHWKRISAPTQVGTSVTECRKWHVREHTARIR